MTTPNDNLREALKAGLALLPELKRQEAEYFKTFEFCISFTIDELKGIIAALEAAEALAALPSAPVGEDAVERVAKAICRENCACIGERACFDVEGAWPNPNCGPPNCHSLARAAISALPAPVPGFVMVPVEPTEAMIEAWEKSKPYDGDYTDEKCATACWKDMVAAASPASGTGGT